MPNKPKKKPRLQVSQKLPSALQAQLAEAQSQSDQFNNGNVSVPHAFSVQNDLKEMQQNNIIDKQWEQTVSKELNQMKSPEQMEQDALAAAGFSQQEQTKTEVPSTEEPINYEQGKEPVLDQQPPELTEDEKLALVAKAFQKYPNCPSVEQLKQWKAMHGGLFFLNIDEDNIYLYRYLKKIEYQQMLADEQYNKLDSLKKSLYWVRKCVLFPVVTDVQFNGKPAGTAEMLAQQIELRSMFLDPAAVAQMTIKL